MQTRSKGSNPGWHPPGHVPLTLSQTSPCEQFPHVDVQFNPYKPSEQAVHKKRKHAADCSHVLSCALEKIYFDCVWLAVLNLTCLHISISLTTICNKIWQTGEWPTPWTKSLVITLPKKGDLQQCQNYRTISLINHPSKVTMKIFLNIEDHR